MSWDNIEEYNLGIKLLEKQQQVIQILIINQQFLEDQEIGENGACHTRVAHILLILHACWFRLSPPYMY